MRETRLWLLLSLLLCVICGRGVFAQNTNSGDIRGTATDPTGAVIPGVEVEVKDVDKGVIHNYVTDNAGLYDTGSITPDHYLITFTKSGFETFVRGPITLDVSTQTVNGPLKVGSTDQQVVVDTDLALLTTESGAQEGTLSSQTMANLPQTGADWENFVILLPGASGAPEQNSTFNAGQVSSINGNLPFESMLADGATTTLPMSQNSDVTIFETTQEVKVSVTGFSAQYGVGDIIYNQITKGGTNSFHGAGYEYFQNNALDAAPYAFGSVATVPVLRYNNFGFAVGGPVLKNKLFFYFDYDKTIQHGGAAISFNTVPTAALEAGNFTAAGIPTLYDPTTQTIQQTGTYTYTGAEYPNGALTSKCPCVIRQSFDSEYHNGNVLPPAMLSKVAQNIQAYWPSPNTTPQSVSSGVAQGNFTSAVPGSTPFTKYFGRLDYDITGSNRFTASVTESDNPVTSLGIGICPINCQPQDVSRHNAQVSDVWTISSRLINEARLGFTDQLNFFVPDTLNQGFPAKLGLQFAQANDFPQVTVGNFYELGNTGSTPNAVYKEMVFDPSDVVTMIRGRHVLHFGGEYLINRADSTAWGNINAANIGYTGTYTSQGGQATIAYNGGPYADFLLGQTQNWTAKVQPEYGARWKSPQLFVQDDYKLRPNLTVNLGLRYEIQTAPTERANAQEYFDPTAVNPISSAVGFNVPGALVFNSPSNRGLYNTNYKNFAPRIGAAYQATNHVVVRSGYGIFYVPSYYGNGPNIGYSQTTPWVTSLNSGLNPSSTLSGNASIGLPSAFPNGQVPATGNSLGGLTDVGFGLNPVVYPDRAGSYVQQWMFGVEYAFTNNDLLDVSYVGNHGVHVLAQYLEWNELPASDQALGNKLTAMVPNPFFGKITSSGCGLDQPTIVYGQLLRPFPEYCSVTEAPPAVGDSTYNALQATFTHRWHSGLQLNVSYTYSKFLDDVQGASGWAFPGTGSSVRNSYDLAAEKAVDPSDLTHSLVVNHSYELPIGQGKKFGSNWSKPVDSILGGWQWTGIVTAHTGLPLSINPASNNTAGFGFNQRPNIVPGVDPVPQNQSINNWINPAAFAQPAAFTFGDAPRFLSNLRAPGFVNFDTGIQKWWKITESMRIQFRFELFNAFNHPNFFEPDTNLGDATFGTITSAYPARSLQFAGKFYF